jgi:coronin-7
MQIEYFQDDIFPDTKVTYEPVMSSREWLSGAITPAKTISLKPKDMKLCKFFLNPIFSFILN